MVLQTYINLHLGANINKLFETLLEDDDINFNDRKRMMDVCRDWYEKKILLKFMENIKRIY